MSIEKTYEIIRSWVPEGKLIGTLEVVKQVEQYKLFWKPKKASVVLLAESHVPTSDEDLKIESSSILDNSISDYPTHLVRFVYCLSYGEDWLLVNPIKNSGTLQFWKIFSSCIAENDNNLNFQKLTKSNNPRTARLRNKIEILKKMNTKGIWLLDASIVGIDRDVLDKKEINKTLEICWDNHIKDSILNVNPDHIIIIGKTVEKALINKLGRLGINFTVLPQPQGVRKSSEEQLENYKKYQRICSKFALN